ncbi:MAG: IPT/TIG domain-containing protein [Terriglobales bacterium]
MLYGDTYSGGTYGDGTFYSFNVGLARFARLVPPTHKVGQKVGILGQGFTGTTNVSFNATPATFTIESDTFLEATVPDGATTGPVTVTTPGGMLTSNKQFRVMPVILSFSPTSGPVGALVTITGTGLTQTTKVAFCGVPASSFTIDSDTQVTAIAPAGAHDRIAITTAGGKVWSAGTFTLTP